MFYTNFELTFGRILSFLILCKCVRQISQNSNQHSFSLKIYVFQFRQLNKLHSIFEFISGQNYHSCLLGIFIFMHINIFISTADSS